MRFKFKRHKTGYMIVYADNVLIGNSLNEHRLELNKQITIDLDPGDTFKTPYGDMITILRTEVTKKGNDVLSFSIVEVTVLKNNKVIVTSKLDEIEWLCFRKRGYELEMNSTQMQKE